MDDFIPEVLLLNIKIRHSFLFLGTRNCDIVSKQFEILPYCYK